MKAIWHNTFGAVAIAVTFLAAESALAAPVTCPNPLQTGQTNTYTVDPAVDCVWGTDNINAGANDEFLDGLGTNDAAYGNSGPTFGKTWTAIGTSGNTTGNLAGLVRTNQTPTFFDWTVTDNNYAFYALGLMSAKSGTASMTGGSWSHFTLYGSGTTPPPNPDPLPEPGMLSLFGIGLLGLGLAGRRRRMR
jgi:hypothetical protein